MNFEISGVNPDIAINTEETIWGAGGVYVRPLAAEILKIRSDSADDDQFGTGAGTITIIGIDGTGAQEEETIELVGLGDAFSIGEFSAVNSVVVVTAGSLKTNAGTIAVEQLGSGYRLATITPNVGRSFDGVFTVPLNDDSKLKNVSVGCFCAGKPYPLAYVSAHIHDGVTSSVDFLRATDSSFDFEHVIAEDLLPGQTIEFRAYATEANVLVSLVATVVTDTDLTD